MSSILACTDGSIYASSVYQHAAWATKTLSADLNVLHVLEHERERSQRVDLSGSIGVEARAHLNEELAKLEEAQNRVKLLKGKEILQDARQQLTAAGVLEDRIHLTQRHGALVDTIAELELEHDFLVIGKRGEHADFDKGHLGSHLPRIIRSATRPVMVAARKFTPLERFVFAYDGSPSVHRALDFVRESPLLKGLSCHLLRAGHIDDKANWYLQEAASGLRSAGFEVTTHAINGQPTAMMAEALERENAQLLVMGAHGHSPIRHLILGSTTTAMIRSCQVPVLILR